MLHQNTIPEGRREELVICYNKATKVANRRCCKGLRHVMLKCVAWPSRRLNPGKYWPFCHAGNSPIKLKIFPVLVRYPRSPPRFLVRQVSRDIL